MTKMEKNGDNYGIHLPFTGEWIEQENEQQTIEETKDVMIYPSMYEVVLLNDDFTPMDFVVTILQQIFYKSSSEANEIMLQTHNTGEGHCGSFTKDVAETKMTQVIDCSRKNEYPLKCVLQKK